MRKLLVLGVVVMVLGWLFLNQKQHEQKMAASKQLPATRQVSEHDWAKRSLDRTTQVTREVARQRKEDAAR